MSLTEYSNKKITQQIENRIYRFEMAAKIKDILGMDLGPLGNKLSIIEEFISKRA